MKQVDLLIENGYVITMEDSQLIIEGGTVAVKDGRIVDLGPAKELVGRYEAPTRIDAKDKVVMPGLLDTHSHAAHTLVGRTVLTSISVAKAKRLSGGYGWRTMSDHVYFRSTGPEFWYADGLLQGLERLKFGTTFGLTLLSSSPRGDRPEPAQQYGRGVAEVGIRSAIAVGPARPPWPRKYSWWENGKKTDYTVTLEDIFKVVAELAKTTHGSYSGRVSIWVGASRFSTPSRYDPMYKPEQLKVAYDQARLMGETAREYGLRIHTHAYGGTIEFIKKEFEGVLGPHVCLAHCQGISKEEIQILADTGTSVAYSPRARRLHTFKGFLDVPECLDRGVNVAISTDASGMGRTFEQFQDMRFAMAMERFALTDGGVLPEGRVLKMVTIDAARALGVEDELGSLKVGKKADIITVNLRAPYMVPRFMIPYRVVHCASGYDVMDVVVDGRLLMRDRRVLTVDENKVLAFADEQARLAIKRSGIAPLIGYPAGYWDKSRIV